jgi:hypothetical protein
VNPWKQVSYTAAVQIFGTLFIVIVLAASASGASKADPPVLRWDGDAANCTQRAGDDGRVYYGISSHDFEITLAVDRQELEKTPHRALPAIAVFLTFHYKGSQTFDIQQNRFSLEFVKHFQTVQTSLDPDDTLKRLQDDSLTDEIERHQVKKHPDQKQQKETELQARLKDYTEMMDFISTRALRPLTLDGSNSTASGWVFFNIKSKWIGPWRRPEQFILRLPVENVMVEFPFSLPPQGTIELKRRPGE